MSSQDHLPQPATERDPITGHRSLATAGNTAGLYLQQYFRSGWAFFIPYLAAYLLYAWLKWPVNPVVEGAGSREQGAGGWVPSLLHVYWVLHAVHLVLGTIAMRFWLRHASLLHSPFSLLLKAAPWICLALIFLIPGIYLEWPSDPWEHLRRINEWHILDQVSAHSAWKKFGYFLPYSLTGQFTGLTQLSLLKIYYTLICLLLSWQYFRLARTVGLGDRAAMIFVLLNALTFGNHIFSFYRYYGLSSTTVAQIAAIAAVRSAIDYVTRSHDSNGKAQRGVTWTFLVLLMIFNHPQAVGMVALAIPAVLAWKLVMCPRRRVAVFAIAITLLVCFAMILAVPSPALESLQRTGWIAPWYGLNLTSPSSPAFVRAAQILGWLGGLNLLASLWLIRRKHIAGFLTFGPIALLALPAVSIPLVAALTSNFSSENSVFLFQRLLFAIPSSLAIVTAIKLIRDWLQIHWQMFRVVSTRLATVVVLVGLVFVVAAPGSSGARIWHSLCSVPADLTLRSHVRDLSAHAVAGGPGNRLTLANKIGADVLETLYSPRSRSLLRGTSGIPQNFLRRSADFSSHPVLAIHRKAQKFDIGIVAGLSGASQTRELKLSEPEDWTFESGPAPVFERTRDALIIANAPGESSVPFSRKAVPIDRLARYRVSAELEAVGRPSTQNYLAVMWYDSNHTLLLSRELSGGGTTYPSGWTNGDFSYFGLAANTAPTVPTVYTVDFGFGEASEIPREAAYFRVGALLNQDRHPGSQTRLRRVTVVEKAPYDSCLLAVPAGARLFSSGSIAGRLSGHWMAWQVAIDHMGANELVAAARSNVP